MKLLAALAVLLMSAFACAQGPKSCDELKGEIAKKLEAKGVKSYALEIVAKDKEAEGTVVGTCEAGTKKIVYRQTAAQAQPAPAKKSS